MSEAAQRHMVPALHPPVDMTSEEKKFNQYPVAHVHNFFKALQEEGIGDVTTMKPLTPSRHAKTVIRKRKWDQIQDDKQKRLCIIGILDGVYD